MKIIPLFLAGSLAANLVLIALLVAGRSEKSAPDAGRSVATKPTANAMAADASSPTAEAWTALMTENLAGQRDRLRDEGFPPKIIRAILAAQIREGFAARRKALNAGQAETPFWKTATPDPKLQAELRAINKEEQKALADLLGPDPENGPGAALHRQFPNLSDDKIAQLATIRDSYDQRRIELRAGSNGFVTLQSDREKTAALDQAMHAELAAVLTPQELEDYDMHTSNTASQLRYNLSAFDATEQEYRALYKLQSAFDETFGPQTGQLSPEEAKARNDAQKQLNDDIKAALGDSRYADYQRARDYNYQQTTKLVARLELPPEAANQIYAVQQDTQQQVRTIQMDRTLQMPDRIQQLSAVADDAKAKVAAVLGPRGAEAYPNNGGSWLQNIVPRVLPPTAPRPAITSPGR